ncbi:MAG TPA: hypothetical protein DCZ03_12785, partial [Gammaproteobacteria bacterium]|nr:hypothetical protein [Gammaproteobacteria bacterium]
GYFRVPEEVSFSSGDSLTDEDEYSQDMQEEMQQILETTNNAEALNELLASSRDSKPQLDEAQDIENLGVQSKLGQILLTGEQEEFTILMAQAARQVELHQLTQRHLKGRFARQMMIQMGFPELETEIKDFQQRLDPKAKHVADLLQQAQSGARHQVMQYVGQQLLLQTGNHDERTLERITRETNLNDLDLGLYDNVYRVVQKMVRRLLAIHQRRKKLYNRGQLDVPKTLRKNMRYDGMLFEPYWKRRKIDRPKLYVLVDVSKSVSAVSGFLLTFLYSLNELLPRVRAFAFSSELGEVSHYFEQATLQEAVEKTIEEFSLSCTDYGRSLEDFERVCLHELDNRATVIILGDGRSNHLNPRQDILKAIYTRAKKVIWLNPEPRYRWGTGDSEMPLFEPYCHTLEECRTLNDLEHVVDSVLSQHGQ